MFMKSIVVLLISFFLLGCSTQKTNPQSTSQANPAAVYCVESGGEYMLDSGECKLSDGKVVKAWDYYREKHPQK
jgi:putative hemolysin